MISSSATIKFSVEKNTIVKEENVLMKKDYMARLERAARWRLPPQEAEDVIADYRDIVSDPPRTEEQLRRDVGDPEQVIKLLVSPPRAYRIWQAAFGVMAFCILSLGFSGTAPGFPFWEMYFLRSWHNWRSPYGLPCNPFVAAALGAVTALVWFRWKGTKSERLSKTIPILMGVLTLWTGGLLLADALILRDPVGFSKVLGEVPALIGPSDRMTSLSNLIFGEALIWNAAAMAVLGTFALVRARTQDRRWAAVYVLAMAALMVPLLTLDMFGSIDPTYGFAENWYLPYLGQYTATFAVGLLGAGVALV